MSRKDQIIPILDGKYLSKAELKNRLLKMDIELEGKDQNKNHYCALYNKLVNDYDRRMKIKSILETDIIDKPEKNLNRKRMRESSEDSPEFTETEVNTKKGKSTKKGKKGKQKGEEEKAEDIVKEEIGGEAGVNLDEINKRNLNSMDGLYKKIEEDLNSYKTNFKKFESGTNNVQGGIRVEVQEVSTNNNTSGVNTQKDTVQIDANTLSFSKDYAFESRKTQLASTFARPAATEEANKMSSQEAVTNFSNVNNNNVKKKLDYTEESNTSRLFEAFNSQKEEEVPQKKFPSIQKVKIANLSSVKNSSSSLIQPSRAENSRMESEPQGGVNHSATSGRNSKAASGVVINVKKFENSNQNNNSNRISPHASSNNLRFNLSIHGSRKSLPGSSKNIKEILNKVEVASNAPVSPRMVNMNNPIKFDRHKFASTTPAMESSKEIIQPCTRPARTRSVLSSSRSIVVSVRPAIPTDLEPKEEKPVFTRHYKDYSLLFLYGILASGVVVCVFLFFQQNGAEAIRDFLSKLDPNLKVLITGMIVSTLGILLYKKFSNSQYFQEVAAQDYENIKELIKNNYSTEEHPLGLFETNFVRDFAKKHNMSEGKYRKNILPHLINIKNSKMELEEKEVLIQEQAHTVWDFIEI